MVKTEPGVATKPRRDFAGERLRQAAQIAAHKFRATAEPLSRSEARAAAPWDKTMPAPWEYPFREYFADYLVERGIALPGRRGGASGASGVTKLDRRLLSQTSEEFAEQDAKAGALGLSWSAWARRKLSM